MTTPYLQSLSDEELSNAYCDALQSSDDDTLAAMEAELESRLDLTPEQEETARKATQATINNARILSWVVFAATVIGLTLLFRFIF